MYLISDNIDTWTGMRLAGVDGAVVHERDELKRELDKVLADKSIGIILLTEKFGREFPEIIDNVKLERKLPLIVEIPDRHGTGRKPDFITSYVVYMDPSDEDKARRLAMHHNVTVKISEYSFNGGIRAVIPSKHILIDSSFKTKLEEARHEFKFDLGGKQ